MLEKKLSPQAPEIVQSLEPVAATVTVQCLTRLECTQTVPNGFKSKRPGTAECKSKDQRPGISACYTGIVASIETSKTCKCWRDDLIAFLTLIALPSNRVHRHFGCVHGDFLMRVQPETSTSPRLDSNLSFTIIRCTCGLEFAQPKPIRFLAGASAFLDPIGAQADHTMFCYCTSW